LKEFAQVPLEVGATLRNYVVFDCVDAKRTLLSNFSLPARQRFHAFEFQCFDMHPLKSLVSIGF
jgi:hypothetical protein